MAERPTPTSIAIATLIALYMDPLSPLHAALKSENDDDSSNTTKVLLLPLQRLVRHPHLESTTLTTMLQVFNGAGGDGNSVSSVLLETMQAVSISVDGLVDLMISIEAAALDHSDGEFGIFCRKICLGFDQLPFEGMTRLWEALRDDVEACTSKIGGTSDGEGIPTNTTSHWSLSPQQKQDLLRLQCLTLDEAVATKSPEELSSQVMSLLVEGGQNEIPAAHFLQFLQHLQCGSKVGALDALHRYFDYAMIAERKSESVAVPTASSGTDSATKGKRRRQVVLHYATLLLAAVHYEFGNVELSQTATQEAIYVAQQSGDPACVAHALSYLHLTSANDDDHNQDVLQRCAVRALQGKLRRLVAGANLTVAQEGTSSSSSWESLVNATTDQPSSSTMLQGAVTTMDRPTHMEDLSSPAEAMEILGQTTLVAGSIWDRMGIPNLSSLTTEIGLECYGQYLTTATKDAAHQSISRKALSGGPPFLCSDDGGDKLCRYGVALLRLKHTGTSFATVRLLHEWAVRRGEYGHAQTLLDYLYSRLHPRLPDFAVCQVEVAAQHCLLLARQGWAEEAKTMYQSLVDSSEKEEKFVQQAYFLIQLAVTLLDTNRQEFRAAVRPLRACLKLTTDHTMDIWHATATSIMAQVHYRMTKSDSAIAMIKGVLPTLRQHAHDIWFIGEAYLTLGKCFMKREDMVHEATDALDKSKYYFLECQDFERLREVYFWQARLYNLKKDVNQREEASRYFIDVSRQLAKGTLRTGLGEIEDPVYIEHLAKRQVHG